ncbi:MAG: hypothetical protein R3Y56_03560 [Akkermansia sp.]
MDTIKTETDTETGATTDTRTSWFATWLQSLGMSQTWANIIATALVSAATAVFALLQTSCGLTHIDSTPTATTLLGVDGSQAIISSTPAGGLSFTWTQVTPEAESVGNVILVDGEAK